jgi:hypothetical protein
MTHFETARINEMLGLQIGIIRDVALKLNGDDLERLEADMVAMERAIREMRSMIESIPHTHQA